MNRMSQKSKRREERERIFWQKVPLKKKTAKREEKWISGRVGGGRRQGARARDKAKEILIYLLLDFDISKRLSPTGRPRESDNYELDSSHDLTRLARAFCSSAMPRVDSAISRASRVRTSAQRIPYTLPFAPLVSREHTYYLANMRACVGRAYSWRASGRPQLSEQIMLLSKCQVSLFCSTFRKLSSHLDENEITRRAMSMLRHPWFPWQIAHHHPSRLIDVEEGLREPYHSKLFHFQF